MVHFIVRIAYFSPLMLALLACGGADGGGSGNSNNFDGGTTEKKGSGPPGFTISGNFSINPPTPILFINTATPSPTVATQTFRAIFATASGDQDLTASTVFSVDDPVGTFAGGEFTSVVDLPNGVEKITTFVRARTADGKQTAGKISLVKLRKTADSSGLRDFFFESPYQGTANTQTDVLRFGTNIRSVDVAFNMDTTVSMSGSIANLRTGLAQPNGLLQQLKAAIPDVGLAIVNCRDYPVSGYGDPGDWPVRVHQTITTDLTLAQAAVAKYTHGGGNDEPEAQISAMWHILTGRALNWKGGLVADHISPTESFGAVDFRPGSLPIVVNITDAPWHNDETASGKVLFPYDGTFVFAPNPKISDLKTTFNDTKAKFVNITSGPESEANKLSIATGSVIPPDAFSPRPVGCAIGSCCTDLNGVGRLPIASGVWAGQCNLNFLHDKGNGVDTSIVTAIQAISGGSAYDITAQLTSDLSNPSDNNGNPIDAVPLIQGLRAMTEGDPANGCTPQMTRKSDPNLPFDDVFVNVRVKTPLCFEVVPAPNTTVPAQEKALFLKARIDVIALPGKNLLGDPREIVLLIPPQEVQVPR